MLAAAAAAAAAAAIVAEPLTVLKHSSTKILQID